MKIKTRSLSYNEVMALPYPKRKPPRRVNPLLKGFVKVYSDIALKQVNFKYEKENMEGVEGKPFLLLMNHSSFLDLVIASNMMYPQSFNIVCTSDGFVGKEMALRMIGCIPTQKFVNDTALIRDIKYALEKLCQPVLMYPEASYTFDGTKTTLPDTLGKLIKFLKCPVVTIITHGSFARDPLYNGLQLRKVNVDAKMSLLIGEDEIEDLSAREINERLNERFSFDNFKWQQENNIKIDEKFRADGLNRILYKCPACRKEGTMNGKGVKLRCSACSKSYTLTEYGFMEGDDGRTEISHIPDWYRWERECVRKELEDGTYLLDTDCDIYMLHDFKTIYKIGSGHLTHNLEGFHLTSDDGELDYTHAPLSSYGLYSDFYWYEIADMICIGTSKDLFYCLPKNKKDVVAKARLAAEELYKMTKKKRA